MLKWAQRDKRLALVMAIDLGLALLVGIIILVQVLNTTRPAPVSAGKATVAPVVAPLPPTVPAGPVPGLTFPALPTVNPTPLVALPNQGQSDAPPLPPGLQALPTTTPDS